MGPVLCRQAMSSDGDTMQFIALHWIYPPREFPLKGLETQAHSQKHEGQYSEDISFIQRKMNGKFFSWNGAL